MKNVKNIQTILLKRDGTLDLLHRYIAAKWYGEDVLEEMTAKGYVVDQYE